MGLIAELKRRKVFKVGAAYLVVAWLAVQATSIGFPAFDVPPWCLRVFILGALLGFPVTLLLAWLFVVTPDGVRFDPAKSGTKRLTSFAALLVVLALGWYIQGRPGFRASDVAAPAVASHAGNPVPVRQVPDDRSIAVMPFVNMTSDKEQDYFSDGLSEELLNVLAQLPQLRVIARTSSFSFKGKAVDVATIAKALNVAHVLEGSVRKSGSMVRITAQLIRTSDSSHLWSATYDRQLTDVLKVQDEIAADVVAALKVKLLPTQKVGNPQQTRDPEAYNQYLLGNQFYSRSNAEGYRQAVEAYRRAIAIDRAYAPAYARLASAEVFAADSAETAAENTAAKQRALDAADKAIALAPELADGYAVRGWMRSNFAWDWAGAHSDLQQARALDPGNSLIQARFGQLLGSEGRLPEAIAEITRATETNPMAAGSWGNLGYYLIGSGNLPEARQALNRALAINPDSSFAHSNLAMLELLQGNAQKALAMYQKADDGFREYGVAMAQHTLGHSRESQRALDALIAGYAHDYAMQIADVYAWRGDKDKAFEWLQRAYAQRDGGLCDIKVDPLLASLRTDPRFAALVRKMGLPA
ncbi:serine/threonine-protein kinase [Lysobacter niabensis]|uniref:Serine/threonine-protein kinase n=1 Tax=Agrilutibacter niabensis TaxID=380628 RepID=A0ABU1VMY0_9GAMM|nr:tetratricopeptide repeat protein [Lysobacter niabensis]MDR7098829.1 serine/threonine-protein kinase [Lysobacter niabensis]